jgi:hypothetical protein
VRARLRPCRQHGLAAHEAPAKTTRTVPYEFKDDETGEVLDVIQDNNRDLPPESDLQEPSDAT